MAGLVDTLAYEQINFLFSQKDVDIALLRFPLSATGTTVNEYPAVLLHRNWVAYSRHAPKPIEQNYHWKWNQFN